MGAVIGTLAAEFTVPFSQWLMLRRELPYGRFLGMVVAYCLLGLVMLGAVRLCGMLCPWDGWIRLGVEVLVGIGVYGVSCLAYWRLTGRQEVLHALTGGRRGCN